MSQHVKDFSLTGHMGEGGGVHIFRFFSDIVYC